MGQAAKVNSSREASIIEIRAVNADLRSRLAKDQYTDLISPNAVKSILAFALDWFSILAVVSLVHFGSYWFSPLALFVVGSRQRALSNLVHDASHGNIFRSRVLNDAFSNLLGAFPMLDTVEVYRASHMSHHTYLGSGTLDPDSRSHLRYGYDDSQPKTGPALKTYLSLLLNGRAWKDSILGGFLSIGLKNQISISMMLLLEIALLGMVIGSQFTGLFLGIWILARATTYHAIRLFSEFLDHSGLPNTSVVSFTRNLPHVGPLQALLHPHNDTYHLVHHLLPKVPHYKLAKADSILDGGEIYSRAHHCDGYFFGRHSAVSCWMGKCKGATI